VSEANAKFSREDILQAIADMSVMDLTKLVKDIEDKFDVSAAAPVAVAGGAASGGGDAAQAEEQTEFTVKMKSFGDKKINVIKAIRTITGLALKEAKDMVESAPVDVKVDVSKEEAGKIAEQLKEAGADISVE
jgi:large subunit ribosomal protein L7/L12